MNSFKNILIVVGTRPNFIKVTQFKKVIATFYTNIALKIVHTGQHYDSKMADVFFEQFNLVPDFFLNILPASANTQMATIMLKLEELMLTTYKPDLVLVVGDVNSTLAAALTANKLNIPIGHIESGLRSYDSTMPEEHNRILTDKITDYYFITEQSGWDNLIKEGVPKEKLFFVGNTMIDTMVAFEEEIEKAAILSTLSLAKNEYVLMTMHRPATVDTAEGLTQLLDLIDEVCKTYSIVFPIHPRTLKNAEKFNLLQRIKTNTKLILTEPLDYFAFQKLIKYCKFILTDSGGIQEESTFRQVPCLTLRPNTERPITCTIGSNTLVPFNLQTILSYIKQIEDGTYKKGQIPKLWDGKATERIAAIITK